MKIPKYLKKKLIIGSVNFGTFYGIKKKKIKFTEISKILNFAYSNGIKHIDSAESYGSEKIIAKYNNFNFKIITKFLFNSNFENYEKTKKLISSTIRNLKNHSLEAVLFHDTKILYTNKVNKIFENLNILKKKGYFKKIGVSIYNFNELNFLIKKYKLDIVQCPFNILDNRLMNKYWINILKKNKVEIHSRSIFLKGLLLNKKFKRKNFFKKARDTFDAFENFLHKNKITEIESALNYVIKNKKISKIVIGVDSLDQLKEILNSYVNKKINYKFKMKKLKEKFYNPSKWPVSI